MGAPPMVRSNSPVTASRLSRQFSTSSLRGFMRHSRRLSPSFANLVTSCELLICQVAESIISRWSHLSDHPFAMNRAASQSRSSGCVGFSPKVPKFPGVRTRASPKCHSQTRLTITRAVSGLLVCTTASASSRLPLPSVNCLASSPAMICRNLRGAKSPFLERSPLRATCMSALPFSFKT